MREKRINYNSDFWRKRAQHYNKLEWVNHQLYLDAFVEAGKFRKTDKVIPIMGAFTSLGDSNEEEQQ